MTTSDVGLQPLENKALSWGIIGKSAPMLAEITIRKSQDSRGLPAGGACAAQAAARRVTSHATTPRPAGSALWHVTRPDPGHSSSVLWRVRLASDNDTAP